MRNPSAWDEEYLQQLPVGEFDWLEIKGRRGLDLSLPNVQEPKVRATLSKAISAFANSGGGTLVFGLKDPDSGWIVDDGGVDLTVKNGTREWLEDIIPQLVDDQLRKFNVYVIQRDGENSQIAEGRGIFVIEIADSGDAPHQANDNKYYARVGGKSRPIGHRIVRDIFGRRQHPSMQPEFRFMLTIDTAQPMFSEPVSSISGPTKPKQLRQLELEVKVRNSGKVVAHNMRCFVHVPIALVEENELQDYNENDFEYVDNIKYVVWSRQNTRRDIVDSKLIGVGYLINNYGPSWFDPILPRLAYNWEWKINSNAELDKISQSYLLWEIYCDDAPVQQGKVMINEIELVVINSTNPT